MEGYDINKIKQRSDKSPKEEELLTGKVITGLDNYKDVKPNAELEGGEYIQFPDGTTQLVVGEKHSKGGVKMFIPDGSRMLSATLGPNAEQRKIFKNDFDLSVKKGDSWADVQNKYTKKIGLEKKYNEQEELIKQIKKFQENSGNQPDATRNLNEEYLSGKMSDLENETKTLEAEAAKFFNVPYDMQESLKTDEQRMATDDGTMKYGGVSRQQFKELCDKHGISVNQGMILLGERMPNFEGGGEFEKLKQKYDTNDKINDALNRGEITAEQYAKLYDWIGGTGEFEGSGKVEGVDYTRPAGADVRVSAPYEEAEGYTDVGIERLNIFREKFGLKKIPKGSSKETIKKGAGELQKHMIDNYPELVYDYMLKKSHKPNKKLEAKLNEINTKKKKNYSIDNEGLNEAIKAGDLTKDDITEGYKDDLWWYRALDTVSKEIPESEFNILKDREGAIVQGDKIYFAEDPSNPELYTEYTPIGKEPAKPEEPETEPKPETDNDGEPIKDDIVPPHGLRSYPRLFFGPNEYSLPPTGMQSHLMANTRLQRMDPIRIGIEPQIQEAGRQREFLAEQLYGSLNPNIAAATMSNALATQTSALNQEALKANMVNAQNLANTELFNIGQAGKESEANNANRLSFEQRQYMAQAKTEEEIRNWYDQIRRIDINRYHRNSTLNLMNQLFPDFNVSSDQMSVNYEPTEAWKLREDPFFELFNQSPYV